MRLAGLYRIQFFSLLAAVGCPDVGCCGGGFGGSTVCAPFTTDLRGSDASSTSSYACMPPDAGSSAGPACACVKDLAFSCFLDHRDNTMPQKPPVASSFSSSFDNRGSKKMLHVILADGVFNCESCLNELCWANRALDANPNLAAEVDLLLLSISDQSIVKTFPVKGCYTSLKVKSYAPLCFDSDPMLNQVKTFFNVVSSSGGNSPISVLIRYSDMRIIYYGDKMFQTDWIGFDGTEYKAAQQYQKYLDAIADNSICP